MHCRTGCYKRSCLIPFEESDGQQCLFLWRRMATRGRTGTGAIFKGRYLPYACRDYFNGKGPVRGEPYCGQTRMAFSLENGMSLPSVPGNTKSRERRNRAIDSRFWISLLNTSGVWVRRCFGLGSRRAGKRRKTRMPRVCGNLLGK